MGRISKPRADMPETTARCTLAWQARRGPSPRFSISSSRPCIFLCIFYLAAHALCVLIERLAESLGCCIFPCIFNIGATVARACNNLLLLACTSFPARWCHLITTAPVILQQKEMSQSQVPVSLSSASGPLAASKELAGRSSALASTHAGERRP